MGMAASQARFLGLTARQNNVEFEGQQINQQRTLLANQSANYYNDLLGMSVPTPPSADQFTKTMYSFNDGALTNTITSMIAQSNGFYTMSYLAKWQDDYSVIPASTSVINRIAKGAASEYNYYVGATTLRKLGEDIVLTPPQPGTFIPQYGKTLCADVVGRLYFKSNECTKEEIKNLEYYYFPVDPRTTEFETDEETGISYYTDENGDRHQALFKVFQVDSGFAYVDENKQRVDISQDQLSMILNADSATDASDIRFVEIDENGLYLKEDENATIEYLTDAQIKELSTATSSGYPALEGLSSDELIGLLKEEECYKKLLEQKYGETEWYVRYQLDTTSGKEVPHFYSESSLEEASYDPSGYTLSNLKCYTIGSEQRVKEFKGIENCKIEKDSTGRLINISIPKVVSSGETIYETFALATNTSTDQAALDDAMNQYEYDKALYDQAIEKINSKIEIIQAEDKNLELRLKQLDTEQKAISAEKEAVTKVIEKNVGDTFKTFNA